MAILLIFLAALFLFLGFKTKSNTRLSFIKAFIVTCFISYLFCEIYSLNNSLTAFNIGLGWGLILLGAAFYVFKNKLSVQFSSAHFVNNLFKGLDSFSSKLTIATIVLILLPLFLLALFIPPNNWDSMAYHMPRVMHWIQDKNIYPYPTHIYRQVLTSPLAEYVILNLQVLSGTDTFANLVQFFACIGIVFIISLLAQLYGVHKKGQLFIVLMAISLPMVLFQATTTQTDLLASFFFIVFVYFTAAFIKKQDSNFTNLIFAALSLSLGVLTKYNVALFAFPIALYLFIHIIKNYKLKQTVNFTAMVLFIGLIVLAPFIAQNIYFFGSATGKAVFDNNASIISDHLSFRYLLSNNIKLLADFISIPIDAFNKLIHTIVTGLHKFIGVSENDPGNNWAGEPFIINNHLNEDTAGSIFHFGWIVISLILVFKSKLTRRKLLGVLYFIFSFSLFSLLFRYSAFNFRLLLPLVILLLIVSGYILFKQLEQTKWLNTMMLILFIVALLPVYFNRAKPIIGDPFYLKKSFSHSNKNTQPFKPLFKRTQLDHYFAQNPSLQTNLVSVFDSLNPSNNKLLLTTEFDSYEYLIWVLAIQKLNNNFYIGYLPNNKYNSHIINIKPAHFYNTQLVDTKSHWSILTN